MSRNWTPGQQDAIQARGGTLLVSAAAGSGKTAVLVQRVIERLTDPENPTDADRLLVVTFTKAAAAEMSGRIAVQIAALLEQDPMNLRLQRQQILLSRAHISTIHSFCGELVRENFYKLGVAPDFRILDDSEMALLRQDAVNQALEERYAAEDPVFLQLVDAFSTGHDDARLAQTVQTLYNFVRSHPFPQRWLREKAQAYRTEQPAGQTPWGKAVLEFAAGAVEYGASLTQNSLRLMEEDAAISKAYREAYQADLAGLIALQKQVQSCDWDGLAMALAHFTWEKCKPLRGYAEDPLKNKLFSNRKEVRATLEKLEGLFCASQEECAADLSRLAPLVEKLFEVTLSFSAALDAKKAERRAADFGDLEHWALKLLVNDTENGPVRTQEAAALSLRFDEVMVDEYQDTNEAQDMIFRAVSQEEKNLFLVGDVKQSIYSFRQAMPQIFLRRRQEYPLYDRTRDEYPACVLLDRNFRSAGGVTDAVNFVFRQLMSRAAGDLDYTGEEELVPAAPYPPTEKPAVELEILDLSNSDAEETMVQAESRRLAEFIYRVMKEERVTENGVLREVEYRDICILLRSANRYAPEYARQLQACGIPAWAETGGGFFAAPEVAVAISLLRVLDNPVQDIPLLSVLMSPIYGFTPDELAEIRMGARGKPLYLAVRAAAENGNARAADFLQGMEEYRVLAATMPADELINLLYERTGYPDMVQAMENGGLRLSNLRLLQEYAKKYEASGYNGLSGLIRFLDRLQEQDADLSAASSISEAANVVKIMSIHHSKGLEFPICVLAGCSRRFNKERGDVLLHPALGLGVKLRDEATGCRYTTLPREAVALELDRSEMSEELRVLYVAMTRAKEKLLLLTTVKNADKTLGRLAARLADGPRIPPHVVRSVSSISDWLLLCALRHPSGGDLRDRAGALPGTAVAAGEPWEIRITYPDPPDQAPEALRPAPDPPDMQLLQQLRERVEYRYPYAPLTGVQAKVAASDLAAHGFSSEYAAAARPAFLGKKGLTPAERGTALHEYMQFADYEKAREDPQKERERLVSEKFLTREQADAVELGRVRAFFRSALAGRMLSSPRLLREYRFSVELPANRVRPGLPPEMQNEPVVLQGAVDCAFEENGQLVLVDYKTDRTENPQELWERYRAQLALYREALGLCTGLPVGECLLYSFHLNSEVRGGLENFFLDNASKNC